MHCQRISIGFDLRVNPHSQKENPAQANQWLRPELRNPVSVDPSVWLRAEKVDSFMQEESDSCNPLGLANDIDPLLDASRKQRIATPELLPVCFTTSEAISVASRGRFGQGYFENQPEEETLLSSRWQLRGFDAVDLNGLISGLKGCGYAEPSWSQLRECFAGELNELGLFRDETAASRFAEVRGLQIRDHAPFVVVGVLTQT